MPSELNRARTEAIGFRKKAKSEPENEVLQCAQGRVLVIIVWVIFDLTSLARCSIRGKDSAHASHSALAKEGL